MDGVDCSSPTQVDYEEIPKPTKIAVPGVARK